MQYKVRSDSNKGFGAFSIRNTFILASKPTMSTAPMRVSSSSSSIAVSWALTSNGGSPVLGYKLYQKNITTGGETLIYDGSAISTVTSFTSRGLTAGHTYSYRVSAINRVGESDLSPYSVNIRAAQIPGRPSSPRYVASTSTTITIAWDDVEDNGGALITAYHVYIDDGTLTDTSFDLTGSTSSLTYTLDNTVLTAYLTGSRYRFYITAENERGES